MSGQLTFSERVTGWADIEFGAAGTESTAHLEVAVLLGGARAGWYRNEPAMEALGRRDAPAGLHMICFDRGQRIVSVDGEWDYRLEPEANVLLLDDADQIGKPPRLVAMLRVDPDLSRALPKDRRDERDRTDAEAMLEALQTMQSTRRKLIVKIGHYTESESGGRAPNGAAEASGVRTAHQTIEWDSLKDGAPPPELIERLRLRPMHKLQASAILSARLRGDEAIRRFIAW